MKRLRLAICATIFGLIGCSEGPDSTIGSVRDQISEASSNVGAITAKLKDFAAKRLAGDEEKAKVDLKAAIEDAKKLKKTAEKIQAYSHEATLVGGAMNEEQKQAFREKNNSVLRDFGDILNKVADNHRELKKIVREVTAKYGEEALVRDLIQEINAGENAFAAVARRK